MIDRFRVASAFAGGWSARERRRSLVGWFGGLVWMVSVAAGASGRDLWLEADPGATAKPPGERALHLWAGEGFKAAEELPLQKERTSRFDLYADQTRKKDLLAAGQNGQTPVAKLPPEPSACLVVMDRKETPGTIEAERFNQMLADTGQESVIALRTRSGQGGAEGKVGLSECLKALVPGQDSLSTLPNTFYKRRTEQRLEILLQNNPGRLPANRRLNVKVLFEGKPLAGAKVFAYRHDAGGTGAETAVPSATPPGSTGNGSANGTNGAAVTSAQGLAEFKLDQNGPWLLEVWHVRAGAERKGGANGPLEVFEAAYSFAAKDAPPGAVPTPVRAVGGGDGK